MQLNYLQTAKKGTDSQFMGFLYLNIDHVVARLTKISITLSRYSVFRKWEAPLRGLRLFISGNPVVLLCGQIKHWC